MKYSLFALMMSGSALAAEWCPPLDAKDTKYFRLSATIIWDLGNGSDNIDDVCKIEQFSEKPALTMSPYNTGRYPIIPGKDSPGVEWCGPFNEDKAKTESFKKAARAIEAKAKFFRLSHTSIWKEDQNYGKLNDSCTVEYFTE